MTEEIAKYEEADTIGDAIRMLATNDEEIGKALYNLTEALQKLQEGHNELYKAWQAQNHEIEQLKIQLGIISGTSEVIYQGNKVPNAY